MPEDSDDDIEAREVVDKDEELVCDVAKEAFVAGIPQNCRPRYEYKPIGSNTSFPRRGDTLLLSCGYKADPCSIGSTRKIETSTTWEVGGSVGGEATGSLRALEGSLTAELSGKYGETVTEGVEYTAEMGLDTGDLKPGERLLGYNQVRDVVTIWDRLDRSTGKVERVVAKTTIPISGIEGVVAAS